MSISTETIQLFPQLEEKKKKVRQGEQFDKYIFDELATKYWQKCLEMIRDNVSSQVYKTWFEPLKALSYNDNQLTVRVPSHFFCEWIEEHYYNLLQKVLLQVIGEHARLKYHVVVDDEGDSLEQRAVSLPAKNGNGTKYHSDTPLIQQSLVNQDFATNLNPHYTFENFVTGDSNQLASSAAMAITDKPGGTRFNPLILYSDTGLGKTHLVQALGNLVLKKHKDAKVLYTTSERFTMDFINSIQNNKSNDFINFFRSVDVLIVDDIQFFGGKEKTQDNFFHTFNALHQSGKQIILTSDKPPRNLIDVDDRLISRFQWGLIVDIQPPDFEMRMAIIQKKSEDEGITLPGDIVEYIAKNVTGSVREIEGVLIRLMAMIILDRKKLSLDLAKEVVYGITRKEIKTLTIDDIKESVSSYFKISIDQMESKVRKHEIALARQMSMFLAKQFTQLSLKSIGSNFGGRDHSTVLHSCTTIENYLITDPSVKGAYEALAKKLKNGF